MFINIFKNFGFLCVVAIGLSEAVIPDYIHVCKRTDPAVAKCVRESIEHIRPKLKEGIKELGVPPLDPLFIRQITILNSEGSGNSNLKAELHNITLHGAGNFQITKLKLDVGKNIFRLGVKFPALTMDGEYDVNARILVAPVKGKGNFNANVTSIEGQGVLRGKIIQQDGHRRLIFTQFDLVLRIADYNIILHNLFNGDPILSKAVNDLLADSKEELIPAATPFIQRKVSEVVLQSANEITKGLDYDEVFPEK